MGQRYRAHRVAPIGPGAVPSRTMTSRKKTGIIAGVGVGAAAAAALRRRWRGGDGDPGSRTPDPERATGAGGAAFLDHLAAAIRIPTVSHDTGTDTAPFAAFRAFLEATYPQVHRHLHREVVNEHTLVFTWEGTTPDLDPILLMAHQDVVPFEPGTEQDWEVAPFSGEIVDGHLWGRGALDDKGSLIGILEAIEALLVEGFRPSPTIVVLLGHDEEIGGTGGAAVVAERFAERRVRFRFVLDEGGGVVSGVFPGVPPLALIGVGEKASLDVEIHATADGGHSSMPPRHTAVGRVAAAVAAIEDHPMPARMAVQRGFFEVLARVMRGPRGWVLGNPRFVRLVERRLAAQPATNALIRTTAAATVIRGGVKSNVLPQEATAIVNFRVMPGDTVAGVLDHVRSVVGDAVRVRAVDFGSPPADPALLCSTDTDGWQAIAASIGEVYPEATIAPWIVSGATDSRYFASIADGVYRFAPFRLAASDLARIHGTGERIAVGDADGAVAFYRHLIVRAGGQG